MLTGWARFDAYWLSPVCTAQAPHTDWLSPVCTAQAPHADWLSPVCAVQAPDADWLNPVCAAQAPDAVWNRLLQHRLLMLISWPLFVQHRLLTLIGWALFVQHRLPVSNWVWLRLSTVPPEWTLKNTIKAKADITDFSHAPSALVRRGDTTSVNVLATTRPSLQTEVTPQNTRKLDQSLVRRGACALCGQHQGSSCTVTKPSKHQPTHIPQMMKNNCFHLC